MEGLPIQRTGSILSVSSTSSVASTVSLSRQPRTRTRSRTLTERTSPTSDLAYITNDFVEEPLQISSQEPVTPPVRPPRSPQRLEAPEIRSSDASSHGGTDPDPTFVETLPPPGPLLGKPSKAARQVPSLLHLDTGYRPPPSAFSRDPSLTPVVNVRDSVSTQMSGASSSIYPPSTSTASGPESPNSPWSISGHTEPPPVAFELNEVQEYDNDDVSYRLRLLVKNNYFLPPAHSKPSPADFATPSLTTQKKSPRSGAPFLDLFRVGKSRSRPSTPTTPGFDPTLPMLRTTSESIAVSHAFRPTQPRSSSQHPPSSTHPSASRGRVVVVREKMNDIAVAAKQAEEGLKARGAWIEQGSHNANPIVLRDIIDPTDAVDLPLPSASYPFAVQALHGVGVLESVGADILADLPAKSPNLSASYDTVEDSWRKALLHEAIHHSLDTPDVSTFSHILAASTPLASPRSKPPDSPGVDSPNATQLMIQQRIVSQPLMESVNSKHSRQKANNGSTSRTNAKGRLTSLTVETPDKSRPNSYLPQRVETPSGPMTPLCPPPRRHCVNPLYSLSQTDLTNDQRSPGLPDILTDDALPSLRGRVTTPLIIESYDTSTSQQDLRALSVSQYSRDSQVTATSFDTVRGQAIDGALSDPHESDIDGGFRTSLALYATRSRPSLSEYSQASLSPTTSTFQDILNGPRPTSSGNVSHFSIEQQNTFRSPSPRSVAISPPPRISSSLAYDALSPPPRPVPLNHKVSSRTNVKISVSSPSSNNIPQPQSEDPTFHILGPEPVTPPFPLAERRNLPPHMALAVNTSLAFVPVRIHSAPGPSSPTSFFDSIQAQPNAMDDLESSDESDGERELTPIPPKLFIDPRTRTLSNATPSDPRPQIMKHGNFSTPHIRPGDKDRQNLLLPLGNNTHSKQPVENSPIRPSKHEMLPSSSYDFFRYAKEHPLNSLPNDRRRVSTEEHLKSRRNNQKAQESLRKLDGMLIQHMEDEKDTIKRIATHLRQTADSRPNINFSLPPR